jgi:hypothetical protein
MCECPHSTHQRSLTARRATAEFPPHGRPDIAFWVDRKFWKSKYLEEIIGTLKHHRMWEIQVFRGNHRHPKAPSHVNFL